jgi:hypothetical protein
VQREAVLWVAMRDFMPAVLEWELVLSVGQSFPAFCV